MHPICEGESLSKYRRAALALIALAAILRLFYLGFLCPFDLSPDEAYYWTWSQQLDWSYHSKGPLVAWLIRLSCEILGDTMFAVRLPAVLCGSLLLVGLYTLTVQVHRSEKLAFAVVTLALTMPAVAAGALLMTIDAPFTCAWMWALVFGHRAVTHDSRWSWLAGGACILIGALAKHTMILFVPSFAFFLVTSPSMRTHLCRPGFWLMTVIGSMGGVPILLWNLNNGWVTLSHAQMHAGLEGDGRIHWLGPLRYFGMQFGVLLGFWFVIWALAMWRHRPTCEEHADRRFLWWMSAPTFGFFGLFAFKNGGGEANWPIVCYLSGMVLAAGYLAQVVSTPAVRIRRMAWTLTLGTATLGLLLTLLLHEPATVQPVLLRLAGPASERHPLPIRRVDPTSRLRGWKHLAREVDLVRAELAARGIEPALAAERWTQASELRFYTEGHPDFLCLGVALGDRHSQFDLWRPNPACDPDLYLGRTFVLVGNDLDRLRSAFDSFEEPRTIRYSENGCPMAEWTIVIAHRFRGWDQ